MSLKTPPIKTLGMGGLIRMAIDIDKEDSTQEMEGVLKPSKEEKTKVVEEPQESQKTLTEVVLLKVASMLIKFAGVLLQYAEELAELRKEAYGENITDKDASKEE